MGNVIMLSSTLPISWTDIGDVEAHFDVKNENFSSLPFELQKTFAVGHIFCSSNPAQCSIAYADLFTGLSKLFSSRTTGFKELSNIFSLEAGEILNDIPSDFDAALLLEETESIPGVSTIQFALATKNSKVSTQIAVP